MKTHYVMMLCFIVGSAFGASGDEPAYADALRACKFPEPPKVVNAARASERALRRSTQAVHRYAEAMQASLACIEAVEDRLGDVLERADRAAITALYNNGVEQLTAITAAHNEQVRRFKARQRLESADDDVLQDNPSLLGTHH